jgi:hypothetical protein
MNSSEPGCARTRHLAQKPSVLVYPPSVLCSGIPCLANAYLIESLHNWSGHEYYPYIATDGGNMIDSMLAPYPQGHFYCPYHDPPCTRDEGIEAAAYGGSAICDGNEYQQNLLSAVTGNNVSQIRVNELLTETLSVRVLSLPDDLLCCCVASPKLYHSGVLLRASAGPLRLGALRPHGRAALPPVRRQ